MFRLLDDPGLLAVSVLDDLFGGSDFRGVGFFFGGIFCPIKTMSLFKLI